MHFKDVILAGRWGFMCVSFQSRAYGMRRAPDFGACLVEYLLLILFAFSFALVVLPAFTERLSFALAGGLNPSINLMSMEGGGSTSNNGGDASTGGPCGLPGQDPCPDEPDAPDLPD